MIDSTKEKKKKDVKRRKRVSEKAMHYTPTLVLETQGINHKSSVDHRPTVFRQKRGMLKAVSGED